MRRSVHDDRPRRDRRLADLLRREHHALAEFLVALAAFDRDRRWVDLGYRSLFYFLTRELGLPKGPAYYRMAAAGLVRKYPELVEPLRDGRLHLTSVTQLAKVITPENRAEVVPRFFHTSKCEAKEVVAELLPAEAPPLRTVVTPVHTSSVPERGSLTPSAVLPEEPTPCQVAGPVGLPPPRAALPPAIAPALSPRAEVEPLTRDLRRLHVTASRRLVEKLAVARGALSHSHPDAADDEILELGLDLVIERHRKRRGIGARPRKRAADAEATSVAPPPVPAKRSRHVPADVWRAVWERDGGRCVWPLEGGGVCGSTRKLELDHVDGWALGGETTVDRVRVLCAWHNDLHARAL